MKKCSIEGCQNEPHARSWCRKHYMRHHTHGDVKTVLRSMPAKGQVSDFIEILKRHHSEECIEWPFSTNGVGYGMVTVAGKRRLVTRLLCEWKYGLPPQGFVAAHSCGNGHLGCVNPNHISWKSEKANRADMVTHGTRLRGEAVTQAKLTEAQVRKIKALLGSMKQNLIAERFGVSQTTVSKINLGKNWRHVNAL